MRRNGKLDIKTMVIIAMLGAVSGVLLAINFPLPIFPAFYKIDLADLPALLGGFYMGPMAGVLITVIKILVKLIVDSSTTMLVGDFSNLLNTLSFVLPASIIYRRMRTKKGAVISLAVSTVFSSIVAVFLNAYIMLPLYSAAFMPLDSIIAMGTALNGNITNLFTFLMLVVLPFNLIKGGITSIVTFILYKRASHLFSRYLTTPSSAAALGGTKEK